MMSGTLDMTRHRLVRNLLRRHASKDAIFGSKTGFVSQSRRAALQSPLKYSLSASRRRSGAAAQQAQAHVSPPASAAASADSQSAATAHTAADPASTDNAASSSPLGPVDVCEAHTLHVAVSQSGSASVEMHRVHPEGRAAVLSLSRSGTSKRPVPADVVTITHVCGR